MSGGDERTEEGQLLQKYTNRVKLLTEEITHYENEQSVKEWAIKDLKGKLGVLSEELNAIRQDLRIETERCGILEEANAALEVKLHKSETSRQQLLHELEQLSVEKRIISERIRQSYIDLGTRRKISMGLVPDNNSDDEDVNDEQHETDDATATGKDDFKARLLSTASMRSESFEEWYESQTEAEDVDARASSDEEYGHPETFTQQPLLDQYETLIQTLQQENVALLAHLQAHKNRANKLSYRPLFVYQTCPIVIRIRQTKIRPALLLLWQSWWWPKQTCSSHHHNQLVTASCINEVDG